MNRRQFAILVEIGKVPKHGHGLADVENFTALDFPIRIVTKGRACTRCIGFSESPARRPRKLAVVSRRRRDAPSLRSTGRRHAPTRRKPPRYAGGVTAAHPAALRFVA